MPSEPPVPQPTVEKPIREDLFVLAGRDGRPKLVASRCQACGRTFYPLELVCPDCIRDDTLERVEIEGSGTLVSFTRVERGLAGFDSPYILATIKLDAGPACIAQLEDWQGLTLALGMPVALAIGRIKREKDGTVILGPKFQPVAREGGQRL